MAQVWEATDEVLTRSVAVKVLHPHLAADASFVERFKREAIAAARLTHPSIVAIYDTFSDDGVEAIVMELVRGSTLRHLLDERKTLEAPQAVAVVAQVADALECAHRAGIVHRDIKPANILLSQDGRVLVADFGIAKAAEGGDMTGTGATLGTVKYLAPEQVEGKPVDARTDVYALGVVLYECLCGRPPFVADTDAATALARLHQEPMRPRNVRASVPKPIEEVVLRALARDPAGRYASASDLRAGLLAASRGEHVPDRVETGGDNTVVVRGDATSFVPRDPTPPGGTPASGGGRHRASQRSRRGPIFVGTLVAVALIVVALLVFANSGNGSSGAGSTAPGSGGGLDSGLRAIAFDPFGTGGENDAEAHLAVDGNAATLWSTEGYKSRTFGTKPGVGLVVTVPKKEAMKSITIDSPTNDWSFAIYIADGTQPTLDKWGKAVATQAHVSSGSHKVNLDSATGAAVLIWITDVGDEPGSAHARIAEVAIAAS